MWKQKAESEKLIPKFLRAGTRVTLMKTEPVETTVEGRFGNRKMYIIETEEYGLIYVSVMQFLKICKIYSGGPNKVTVEL